MSETGARAARIVSSAFQTGRNVAGGEFQYTATKPGSTALGLEEAHRKLRISSEEFDEVAAELGRILDSVNVPAPERKEVLEAFDAPPGGGTSTRSSPARGLGQADFFSALT